MLTINGGRLLARLQSFAEIGGTAKGGVNRQALIEGGRRARQLLAELAVARGFEVFQDPVANSRERMGRQKLKKKITRS